MTICILLGRHLFGHPTAGLFMSKGVFFGTVVIFVIYTIFSHYNILERRFEHFFFIIENGGKNINHLGHLSGSNTKITTFVFIVQFKYTID